MSIYIGFDLGDGDTSVSVYRKENGFMKIEQLTFPDLEPGEAMPSIAGTTSNNETVIGTYAINLNDITYKELCINFKQKPSLLSEQDREIFKNNIVKFTDCLFSQIGEKCGFQDVTERNYVISIGHPTTWSDEDINLYKEFFMSCNIFSNPASFFKRNDIKVSLQLHQESKAALVNFINSKKGNEDYDISVDDVPSGHCAVIFDFGSSTADVTILKNTNGIIDTDNERLGKDNLGARYIDRSIYEQVILSMDEVDRQKFYQKLRNNPSLEARCIYYCRLAKQKYFNGIRNGKASEGLVIAQPRQAGFYLADIFGEDVMVAALNKPIRELNGLTWKEACEQLFSSISDYFKNTSSVPSVIFLTGGASRMSFITTMACDFFPSSRIINDLHPSRCISHGLAFLPHKIERAQHFIHAVDDYNMQQIPAIVRNGIPTLASTIASSLTKMIFPCIKEQICKWRCSEYRTLNDMEEGIKQEIGALVISNKAESDISECVTKFIEKDISPNIVNDFINICKIEGVLYKTERINVDRDNVGHSQISLKLDISSKISQEIDERIVKSVSMIMKSSILIYIMPVILFIVSLIGIPIVTDICLLLLEILLSIPGIGLTLIAIICCVSVAYITMHNVSTLKEKFIENAKKWDFYQWIRNRVSDKKIDSILSNQESNIYNQIQKSLESDEKFKQSIISNISNAVSKILNSIATDLALRIRD